MDNIPIDMTDGDYVAFQTQEGFVLYHKADGKLWRTVGKSAEDIDKKNSKAVQGISADDGMSRIMMSGHETFDVPEDLGKVQKIESGPPHDDEFDISIEPGDLPPAEPEGTAPLPDIDVEPLEPSLPTSLPPPSDNMGAV